jgi:hypothetical protein
MERRSSDIPYVPRARIEVCPHRNANALWTRTPVFIEGRQGGGSFDENYAANKTGEAEQ